MKTGLVFFLLLELGAAGHQNDGQTESMTALQGEPCPTPAMAAPPYPERLRRRGIGGTTIVSVTADVCGRIVNVRLARSSGYVEIDTAVISAARSWVFTQKAVAKYAGAPFDVPITLNTRP